MTRRYRYVPPYDLAALADAVHARQLRLVERCATHFQITDPVSGISLVDVWPTSGKFRACRARPGTPASAGSISALLTAAVELRGTLVTAPADALPSATPSVMTLAQEMLARATAARAERAERVARTPPPNPGEKVWIADDGRVLPLSQMVARHLVNCVLFCEDNAMRAAEDELAHVDHQTYIPPSFTWTDFLPRIYDRLVEEVTRRGISNLVEETRRRRESHYNRQQIPFERRVYPDVSNL